MRKIIFIAIAGFTILASCKKDLSVPDDFTVSTNGSKFTTTDTVKFLLTGNPDMITFYSGEAGQEYDLSKVTEKDADSTLLEFSTATTAASASTQPLAVNKVSILASTDFSGVVDSASIRKATWTDISGKAVFATSTGTVKSGKIRVDDLKKGKAPVYFAYRYISDTAKTGYLPRKWTVTAFSLKNYFGSTIYPLAGGSNGTTNSFLTGGFVEKSMLNSGSNWVHANTSLTFNAAAIGTLPDEDWSISRPFDFNLFPSNTGVGIKSQNISAITEYQYRFSKPGNYSVTFVGINANETGTREIVRTMTITIQ